MNENAVGGVPNNKGGFMYAYLLSLLLCQTLSVSADPRPTGGATLVFERSPGGPVVLDPAEARYAVWPDGAWSPAATIPPDGRVEWRVPAGERLRVDLRFACGARRSSFVEPLPPGSATVRRWDPSSPAYPVEPLELEVLGHDERPLSGARLRPAPSCPGGRSVSWTTGPGGRVQLQPGACAVLHPEGWPVILEADGHASRVLRLDLLRRDAATVVLEGERVLSGVVLDSRGLPASGCVVQSWRGDQDHGVGWAGEDAPWQVPCDAAGAFEMNGLDQEADRVWWFLGAGGDCAVVFAPSPAADTEAIRLSRPEPVFGRVVDASGEPVAGAAVRAELPGSGLRFEVRTDADGSFRVPPADHPRFGAGLPPVPLRFSCGGEAHWYHPEAGAELLLMQAPERPLGLAVAASAPLPTALVAGQVRDASGRLTPIVRTALFREGGLTQLGDPGQATDGSFLRALPGPGRYRVSALLADGRLSWSDAFEVRGREQIWVELEPRPARSFAVGALDPRWDGLLLFTAGDPMPVWEWNQPATAAVRVPAAGFTGFPTSAGERFPAWSEAERDGRRATVSFGGF